MELLIVIAIIGLLSSIVLASLNTAKRRSRDGRRVAEMRQLALALQVYYEDTKKIPGVDYVGGVAQRPGAALNSDTSSGAYSTTNNCGTGTDWDAASSLRVLIPSYISSLPKDPTNLRDADPTRYCYKYRPHISADGKVKGACLWMVQEKDAHRVGVTIGDPLASADDSVEYNSYAAYNQYPIGFNCVLDDLLQGDSGTGGGGSSGAL